MVCFCGLPQAMRHKETTQQQDRYDRATHDRLQEAATTFCEAYARKFGGGSAAPAKAGAVDASQPEWLLVDGEDRYVFSVCGDAKTSCTFETVLGW